MTSLPKLREDLQLSSAGAALDGSPRWTLADPVRGRYFKLGAIDSAAFFQGGGKSFTIWNPEELAKMGAGWEDAQESCAELAAQAQNGKGRK